MTIVSAGAYQRLAEEHGWPLLEVEPGFEDEVAALLADNHEFVERLFRPVDWERVLRYQEVGTPVLSAEEIEEVWGEAIVDDGPPTASWYWEFLRREDGSFVMFPQTEAGGDRLCVSMLVKTARNTLQLHRLELGLGQFFGTLTDFSPSTGSDDEEAQSCAIDLTRDEPGAPYSGSCENSGCDDGCNPLVLLIPNPGTYLLDGCEC